MKTKLSKSPLLAEFSVQINPCFGALLAGEGARWSTFEIKVLGKLLHSRGRLQVTHIDGSPKKELLPDMTPAIRVIKVISSSRFINIHLKGSTGCGPSYIRSSIEHRIFRARTCPSTGQYRIDVWL